MRQLNKLSAKAPQRAFGKADSGMLGNPRTCRQHALRCAQLAVEANTDGLKAHFLSLSKTWEDLAREHEVAQWMIDAQSSESGKIDLSRVPMSQSQSVI